MKKRLLSFCSILVSSVILTPLITSCSSSNKANVSILTNVHKYINERTFSLVGAAEVNPGSGYYSMSYGTCWLLYHIPSEEANDNYSYYALTNFHVASAITQFIANYSNAYVGYAYQTDDEINGDSTRINESITDLIYSNSACSSQLHLLSSYTNQTSNNDNFEALYTEYLKFETSFQHQKNTYYNFLDLEIVKLDFSDAVELANGQELKNRLDDLNDYASKNSNYVLKFLSTDSSEYSYQKINEKINNSSENVCFYGGGYPLNNFNGDSIYNDSTYKFQYQIFNNIGIKYFYSTDLFQTSAVEMYVGDNNKYYMLGNKGQLSNVYTALNNDYYSVQNDMTLSFGGGASGSLIIYADDVNDSDSYYATGIYWGGVIQSKRFVSCFSPFYTNFGNSITYNNITLTFDNNTFIDDFFTCKESGNLPIDNCLKDFTN